MMRESFMHSAPRTSESRAFLKGTAGLLIAVAAVVILLIAYRAYRWFFLISLGIGLAVAAILFFWHRFRPIREEDVVENKRPLGLD
jgi:fatty acid desaturase